MQNHLGPSIQEFNFIKSCTAKLNTLFFDSCAVGDDVLDLFMSQIDWSYLVGDDGFLFCLYIMYSLLYLLKFCQNRDMWQFLVEHFPPKAKS